MTRYKRTNLYGGAIVCDLPENFADVRWAPGANSPVCANADNWHDIVSSSTIRQVPDNQEVYIDKDGFTSIIFDIMQRVEAPGEDPLERDGRALTTHLEDLVGEDVDTVKVWNTTETQFTHLP
jgi:hypothetical protein